MSTNVQIEASLTNAAAGAEDGSIAFKIPVAGTVISRVVIDKNGTTFGRDGIDQPKLIFSSPVTGIFFTHSGFSASNFGWLDTVRRWGWNTDEGGGQSNADLSVPATHDANEHGFQYGSYHYQRQAERHVAQFSVGTVLARGSVVGPFIINVGDTLVLKINSGANQTATWAVGDGNTADEVRRVVERDTTAKVAVNANGSVSVYKADAAAGDTLQILASNVATACGLAVTTTSFATAIRRPHSITVNWRTAEAKNVFVGGVILADSTALIQRCVIPDGPGDIVASWGVLTAGVSHLTQRNNIISWYQSGSKTGASVPIWRLDNAGQATSDFDDVLQICQSGNPVNVGGHLSLASGKNFSQSGAGTHSTGTGAVSLNGTTTLAAGKNFVGAAGSGALSLGSMTGDAALPAGALSWSGAADKNLALNAAGAGTVIIESAGGAISLGASNGSAKNVTVGSIQGGSTTRVQAGGGTLKFTSYGGAFVFETAYGGEGLTIAQASGSQWNVTGQGGLATLYWGMAQLFNAAVSIGGDLAHSGAAGKIGFFNHATQTQRANTAGNVSAGASYTAQEQAMLDDCYKTLQRFGWLAGTGT